MTPSPYTLRKLAIEHKLRDPVLAAWLNAEAARLETLATGAIEISRHGADVWGFASRDPNDLEFTRERSSKTNHTHKALGAAPDGGSRPAGAGNYNASAHDPKLILVRGVSGSATLVDALCAPDERIELPIVAYVARSKPLVWHRAASRSRCRIGVFTIERDVTAILAASAPRHLNVPHREAPECP